MVSLHTSSAIDCTFEPCQVKPNIIKLEFITSTLDCWLRTKKICVWVQWVHVYPGLLAQNQESMCLSTVSTCLPWTVGSEPRKYVSEYSEYMSTLDCWLRTKKICVWVQWVHVYPGLLFQWASTIKSQLTYSLSEKFIKYSITTPDLAAMMKLKQLSNRNIWSFLSGSHFVQVFFVACLYLYCH
jgi:hypothetical protein